MEKIEERYGVLKETLNLDDEKFKSLVEDLTMFELAVRNVNDIFKGTIYNCSESEHLCEVIDRSTNDLLENFQKQYMDFVEEKKEIHPLPSLEQVVTWAEEIHVNIALQLFTEEYTQNVIKPSFESIASAILEVAEDEEIAESEEEDEAHN
jgi:hypothetical protein